MLRMQSEESSIQSRRTHFERGALSFPTVGISKRSPFTKGEVTNALTDECSAQPLITGHGTDEPFAGLSLLVCFASPLLMPSRIDNYLGHVGIIFPRVDIEDFTDEAACDGQCVPGRSG